METSIGSTNTVLHCNRNNVCGPDVAEEPRFGTRLSRDAYVVTRFGPGCENEAEFDRDDTSIVTASCR